MKKVISLWCVMIVWTIVILIAAFFHSKDSHDRKCSVTEFTHENHSYLRFEELQGHEYDFCIVHNPSCNCTKPVSNKKPSQHSSYVESGVYSGTAKKNVK